MRNEIIIAVFPSRSILTKALDHVMSLGDLPIHRAAVISKAYTGETTFIDDDISADEAGIAGGTLGAAIGALGLAQIAALSLPGVGVIVAIGAGVLVGGLVGGITGRFAANLLDSGFKSAQIEELSSHLKAGHSAIVFEVASGADVLPRLRKELEAYRAEIVERRRPPAVSTSE